MGESIAEALNVENKMRESIASGSTLEVSVSFGRFENDSLSWEKWSSFSPNKYLEEVEKCSMPGSVARKKAYFEAHYKKIAARKAEQLGQEKQMETNSLTEDDQNGGGHAGNTCGADSELSVAIGPAEGVVQFSNSIGVTSSSYSDESNKNSAITMECQSSSVDGAEEELDSIPDSLELNKPEDAVLIQEGIYTNGSQENVKLPPILVHEDTHLNKPQDKVQLPIELEETRNSLETKKENANFDASNKSQKITPTKKERNLAGTKKQPAPALLKKAPQISTPKTSKPTSTSTVTTASRSKMKNANGSLLPRSKNHSAGENKKTPPSSLHMSHSFGPANSEATSLTTTRKSLIMEKMGDKDIVKRAFKTFQNNFNQVRSSVYERSSRQKEVSTTGSDQMFCTSLTPRKGNERVRRTAEKMEAQKSQLGRSWNSPFARSLKGVDMDQRNAKPAPSSFGWRFDERAEIQKFSNKPEVKSYAKEAERMRLSSKSKEEMESEIKKLRQSFNFKATPLPGFYRGHSMSKNPLGEKVAKNERHR